VDLSTVVRYSLDNNATGSWTDTIEPSNSSSSWYSRLEISAGDYSGPVTVTWQLQQKTGSSEWTDVAGGDTTTTITLTGAAQNIYATSDGLWATSNYDWSTDVLTAGTYRVVATVESD
jgi:spore coat protein U-like protein